MRFRSGGVGRFRRLAEILERRQVLVEPLGIAHGERVGIAGSEPFSLARRAVYAPAVALGLQQTR